MGCQGDGAMADYFVVPADKTIHIPSELSLKDAVLVEPLAVGVHAVRKAGDLFGKKVVVIGAGTIGLMVLACVKHAGAERIIVSDLSEERLERADKIGATHTINAGKEDVVIKTLSEKAYEGIDVVFECVGAEKTIRDAMEITRKGGRIIVCGVFSNETTVKMADLQDRELELIGTLMYTRRDVTDAIWMLARRICPPELFISEVYSLNDAYKAFQAAQDTNNNVKVVFEINKE
jgi:threonine dehydrogenase-like Zn-dependent dehydrogenase